MLHGYAMNDKNISDLIATLTINHSHAINIEKFIQIIRGDIDLGLALLTLFKQQAYEYLNNLEYALTVSDKDTHKLFEAAHAIKGASLSIAADEVRDLSAMIEKQVQHNHIIDHASYHQLVKAIQELLHYITAVETRYDSLSGFASKPCIT
jgi:HPt (histidine-containing phosphotransfer) domain-containing protein